MGFGFSPRVQSQFSSLFGTDSAPAPDYTQDQSENDIMGRYRRRFAGMMDPSSPAQDAYNDYLQHIPSRADYAPGKLDRLGAVLGGVFGGLSSPTQGIQTAEYLKNRKYDTAVEDYKLEGAGKKEAADNESRQISGRRNVLNDFFKQQLDADKEAREAALTRAQIGNYGSEDAYRKAQIDELGKRKPNDFIKSIDAQGNVTYVDPNNELPSFGAGVDAGILNAIETKTRDTNANNVANKRLGIEQQNADTYKDKVKKGPASGNKGAKDVPINFTPQEDATNLATAQRNVITRNPEFKQFAETTPKGMMTGKFAVGPTEDGWIRSGNKDAWDRYQKEVKKELDVQRKMHQKTRHETGITNDDAFDVNDFIASLPDRK